MPDRSTTTAVDAQAFKVAARSQWDQAAQGWNDHAAQIRAWLSRATDAMLEMAGVARGARVLDVAAGAGDQTLDIARRVGPEGFVLATDLSSAILSLAQDKVRRAGLDNVQVQVCDGEDLSVDSESFDAVVCRLGLMLFPSPLDGLREMHRALRPGGGACTLVFGRPERSPCVTILVSTAMKHAGLKTPPDPFQPGGLLSLGRPGLVDSLFKAVGFTEVATTTIDAPFELPSARHYVDFVRASASPVRQMLGRLDAAAAAAAWDEIEERLTVFDTASGWEGPNELLLTAGRR